MAKKKDNKLDTPTAERRWFIPVSIEKMEDIHQFMKECGITPQFMREVMEKTLSEIDVEAAYDYVVHGGPTIRVSDIDEVLQVQAEYEEAQTELTEAAVEAEQQEAVVADFPVPSQSVHVKAGGPPTRKPKLNQKSSID